MSYLFLFGSLIFLICWLIGWLRIDFALDRLSKIDLKRLLTEVKRRNIRFQLLYILIFIAVFAVFDLFPTIIGPLKFVCAGAFLIFIVGTGYGALVRIRRLSLPSDLFYSVLTGFAFIVLGYVVFTILIRESLYIRIWH